MKHLGLMSAGDPLSTIPYVGTVGGMVIVSAGDPSCLTSPNEQDQRHLADALHIPMLDPRTAAGGARCDALRLRPLRAEQVARCPPADDALLPHLRPGALRPDPDPHRAGLSSRPRAHLLPTPENARRMRVEIEERLELARDFITASGFFTERGAGRDGILSCGVPAGTCADILQRGRGRGGDRAPLAERGLPAA